MFDISNIYLPINGVTRSISAENPNGEKSGGARALPDEDFPSYPLGVGWKARPAYRNLAPGQTLTLADISGPGIITHMWFAGMDQPKGPHLRDQVLRIYWDGESDPSVEVPIGDFFCNGFNEPTTVNSLPICVNPKRGFNSYWPMPFRKGACITIENQGNDAIEFFFYQIDYVLTEIDNNALYFHATWRRQLNVPDGEEYTILDNVNGKGRFAGVYLAWGQHTNGWWGEGEVKFYIDSDDYPTYCGTGTEDYFGGAWCFSNKDESEYETYSTPYLGYHQHIVPDSHYLSCHHHGLYRWHIQDPIIFDKNFKATIQPLGWRSPSNKRSFVHLNDDIASTAFWYQTEPHSAFIELPSPDYRENIIP